MPSPTCRTLSRFSILVMACALVGACTAPNFKLHDPGLGFSGLAQAAARDRCEGKFFYRDYRDYRDCTSNVNAQYEAWRSQQKPRDIDAFKNFKGRP